MPKKLKIGARHGLVVGNEVMIPSINKGGKLYNFKLKELRFLEGLISFQGDIAKVCDWSHQDEDPAMHWDVEAARRFLSKRDVRKFFKEISEEIAIKRGITVNWWYAAGYRSITSEEHKFSKVDAVVWAELGNRLVPKVERVLHEVHNEDMVLEPTRAQA